MLVTAWKDKKSDNTLSMKSCHLPKANNFFQHILLISPFFVPNNKVYMLEDYYKSTCPNEQNYFRR